MAGDLRPLPGPGPAGDPWLDVARAAAVGQLVPGAVHELNNSLTTILGHVQVLLGRPDLSEDLGERLQILASEGARAARVLHALLAVSRAPGAVRRPCSLADHAQRVLDLLHHGLRHDGIRVETDFGACPAVRIDEQDLQQIILALFQRARQVMRGQGDGALLTVRTGTAPEGARLQVLDTGPPGEAGPPARGADALALGPVGAALALAAHLGAAAGGRLHAESRPGRGMAFTLDLPAAAGRE
jgi:signal transduction histidine kinase